MSEACLPTRILRSMRSSVIAPRVDGPADFQARGSNGLDEEHDASIPKRSEIATNRLMVLPSKTSVSPLIVQNISCVVAKGLVWKRGFVMLGWGGGPSPHTPRSRTSRRCLSRAFQSAQLQRVAPTGASSAAYQ